MLEKAPFMERFNVQINTWAKWKTISHLGVNMNASAEAERLFRVVLLSLVAVCIDMKDSFIEKGL